MPRLLSNAERKLTMVASSAHPQRHSHVADIVAQVVRAPAAWLFAAVWLASLLVLVVSGHDFDLLTIVVFPLLTLATAAMTQPQTEAPTPRAERPRVWLYLGLTLLFVVLTGWRGLVFHKVLAPDAYLPLWSPLVAWLQELGAQWFGNITYVANPVTYVALPLLALLLAGARLPNLGFRRGSDIRRVLLLWCAMPLVFFAYALLGGQLTPARLMGRFITNFLANGFSEEFLFRGALQTQLHRLTTPGWALVIQALVFGAWHLGLGYTTTGHSGLLPALATVIVHQALVGLAYGVIFERTRNLLAPSIVHFVVDSMS